MKKQNTYSLKPALLASVIKRSYKYQLGFIKNFFGRQVRKRQKSKEYDKNL